MSHLLDGKCAAPKNPKPGVTTYFCVYSKGHEGDHSWMHTAEERHKRLVPANEETAE